MTLDTPEEFRSDIAWLKKRIKDHISGFEKSKDWYRSRAKWFGVSGAIFSSVTTVFVALQQIHDLSDDRKLKAGILALVLSAATTIIASLDSFFDAKKLWVRYGSTLNALYSLADRFDYALIKNKDLSPDEVDKFNNDLQALLDDNNADWAIVRASSYQAGIQSK